MKNLWLTILALLLFVGLALGFFYILRDIVYQPSTVLTSTECDPPCWNSVRPGVSTFTELSNDLWQMEGVDQLSITVSTQMPGGDVESISWLFRPPVRDISGSVYFENEVVTAISLLTMNSLKLEDVFERLGEPELIWLEIVPSNYREPVEISLLYPEKGFLIESVIDIKEGGQQVEITKNMKVYRVVFFDPQKYQDLLETRILIRRPPPTRRSSPEPWPGFGAVQVKGN